MIFGAGGIGCYYGVRLLSNGHDVSFIARGKHLQAIQENGLQLEHPELSYSERVKAYSFKTLKLQSTPMDFDFILLTTKATSTTEIAKDLAGWFSESNQSTAVISLQNGIDNETIVRRYLNNDDVIGGLAIRIGGHITRPGKVEAKGVAQIKMGLWPNQDLASKKHLTSLLTWAKTMNEAGIPTEVVADIRHELWAKLAINHAVNPLSVLTELDTKQISNDKYLGSIVYQLMKETALVAKTDGVLLSDKDVDKMYQLICNFDAIKTSMLVDWEKGGLLEIDAIPGAIISRATQAGIEVPYSSTVFALLKKKIARTTQVD